MYDVLGYNTKKMITGNDIFIASPLTYSIHKESRNFGENLPEILDHTIDANAAFSNFQSL